MFWSLLDLKYWCVFWCCHEINSDQFICQNYDQWTNFLSPTYIGNSSHYVFKTHLIQFKTYEGPSYARIPPLSTLQIECTIGFLLVILSTQKNALWKRFVLLLKHAKGLSNIILTDSRLFVTLLVHFQLENPLGNLKIQGWMTSMS